MRFVGLVAAALILGGCQPDLHDYYVIQFAPGPGVVALDSGKPENDMVLLDDEVVTAYRLERASYTLVGKLDFTTSHPTVDIAAHDAAGEALGVVPGTPGACGSFESPGVEREVSGFPAKRYSWRPHWGKACPASNRGPYPAEQVMVFEVRTVDGEVVASEKMAFDVQRNGKYLEYDTL